MSQTTKTLLLASTVIPTLVRLSFPGNAAALQADKKIILAQQQEPAEKSDRPERRRPEGAPGTPAPSGARPPQGQKGPAPDHAAPPQTPASPERRELPKGPGVQERQAASSLKASAAARADPTRSSRETGRAADPASGEANATAGFPATNAADKADRAPRKAGSTACPTARRGSIYDPGSSGEAAAAGRPPRRTRRSVAPRCASRTARIAGGPAGAGSIAETRLSRSRHPWSAACRHPGAAIWAGGTGPTACSTDSSGRTGTANATGRASPVAYGSAAHGHSSRTSIATNRASRPRHNAAPSTGNHPNGSTDSCSRTSAHSAGSRAARPWSTGPAAGWCTTPASAAYCARRGYPGTAHRRARTAAAACRSDPKRTPRSDRGRTHVHSRA